MMLYDLRPSIQEKSILFQKSEKRNSSIFKEGSIVVITEGKVFFP